MLSEKSFFLILLICDSLLNVRPNLQRDTLAHGFGECNPGLGSALALDLYWLQVTGVRSVWQSNLLSLWRGNIICLVMDLPLLRRDHKDLKVVTMATVPPGVSSSLSGPTLRPVRHICVLNYSSSTHHNCVCVCVYVSVYLCVYDTYKVWKNTL